MENQHKLITGYRDLTQEEIDAMNEVKRVGKIVGRLVKKTRATPNVDGRWCSIGETHLQQGLMALARAVAKPTTF